MALYSVELRRYIDSFSQYNPSPLSIREKIEIGRPKLFDFWYPFFDEKKRKDFETNIIRRFYMVEVGFETMELFKFHLENWLLVNMDYWNKMFESELLEFNPFLNTVMDKSQNVNGSTDRVDLLKTLKDNTANTKGQTHQEGVSDTTGDGSGNSDTTGENIGHVGATGNQTSKENDKENTNAFERKVEADTPDNRLGLTTEDGKGILQYASNIGEDVNKGDRTTTKDGNIDTKSDQDSKQNTKSNTIYSTKSHEHTTSEMDGTSNEDYVANEKGQNDFNSNVEKTEDLLSHYEGKIGSETYQEMLEKYRKTFLRIEKMIHQEMRKDLFMLVY